MFAMGSTMDQSMKSSYPKPFYANYNGFQQPSGVTAVPGNSTIETSILLLPAVAGFEKN
jgi:hypothetical protein